MTYTVFQENNEEKRQYMHLLSKNVLVSHGPPGSCWHFLGEVVLVGTTPLDSTSVLCTPIFTFIVCINVIHEIQYLR